ncbi:MAG: CPBP family intramembrane metalloprotease [Bacteroidales bacterium]|nr:CPBP family intramembrane metalloprotease [Bacteroidales bacterium]
MTSKEHYFDERGFATKGFLNGIKAFWCIILFYVIFSLLSYLFSFLIKLLLNEESFLFQSYKYTVNLLYPVFSNFLAVVLSAYIIKILFYKDTLKFNLSIKGQGRNIVYGFLFVLAIYTVGYLLSLGLGWIEIVNFNWNTSALLSSFIFFLLVSFSEEIMCRGVIQQLLMDIPIPKFLALVITAGLFTLLHLANPGIGWLPLLNLFLAGLILGLSLLFSRNLWFPISFHLFWNWIQGPLLGYKVSGLTSFVPLIHIHGNAPEWITGGDFGFEGSIVCSVLLLLAFVFYTFS